MNEPRLYRFKKGSSVKLTCDEDVDIKARSYDEAYDKFLSWLDYNGYDDCHTGIDCEGIGFNIDETDPS